MWNVLDVENDNNQSYTNIHDTHHRNEHLRYIRKSLCTTQNNRSKSNSKNYSDNLRGVLIVKAEGIKCRLQVICSEHVVSYSICKHNDNREEYTEPSGIECITHIVCRSTIAVPFMVSLLINLSQRRLNECRRTAK